MKRVAVVLLCLTIVLLCTNSYASDSLSHPINKHESHSTPIEIQPGPGDITKERAIDMAREIFTFANPIPEDEVNAMSVNAAFFYYDEYMFGFEPVWLVKFESSIMPEGHAHRMLYTYDGIFLDYAKPGEELTTPYMFREKPWDRMTTVNTDGVGFYDWSVEEKAAFSQKWIPVVETYCKENRHYTGDGDDVFCATRHVYGLPDEDDISQEEARTIAEKAAMEHGATKSMLARRTVAIYFDITNPDMSLWKLWYRTLSNDEAMGWQEDDIPQYFIIINAQTGEVVNVDTSNAPYGRY